MSRFQRTLTSPMTATRRRYQVLHPTDNFPVPPVYLSRPDLGTTPSDSSSTRSRFRTRNPRPLNNMAPLRTTFNPPSSHILSSLQLADHQKEPKDTQPHMDLARMDPELVSNSCVGTSIPVVVPSQVSDLDVSQPLPSIDSFVVSTDTIPSVFAEVVALRRAEAHAASMPLHPVGGEVTPVPDFIRVSNSLLPLSAFDIFEPEDYLPHEPSAKIPRGFHKSPSVSPSDASISIHIGRPAAVRLRPSRFFRGKRPTSLRVDVSLPDPVESEAASSFCDLAFIDEAHTSPPMTPAPWPCLEMSLNPASVSDYAPPSHYTNPFESPCYHVAPTPRVMAPVERNIPNPIPHPPAWLDKWVGHTPDPIKSRLAPAPRLMTPMNRTIPNPIPRPPAWLDKWVGHTPDPNKPRIVRITRTKPRIIRSRAPSPSPEPATGPGPYSPGPISSETSPGLSPGSPPEPALGPQLRDDSLPIQKPSMSQEGSIPEISVTTTEGLTRTREVSPASPSHLSPSIGISSLNKIHGGNSSDPIPGSWPDEDKTSVSTPTTSWLSLLRPAALVAAVGVAVYAAFSIF